MGTIVSAKGRRLTPDPMGGDITSPQSLNRYAYALNNPTTLVDPLGLTSTFCAPGVICTIVTASPPTGGSGGGILDFGAEPPLIFAPTMHPGPAGFCGPMQGCWWNKPAPKPPLVERIANVAHCASSLANTLSIASLTGLNKYPITETLFSNVFSSATDLVFGTKPNEYVPSGASVVAGTKGMNLVSRGLAAGAASASSAEVNPGLQFIFSSVPATKLGETVLGKAAVRGVQALGDIFAYGLTVYDAGVYAGALDVCAQ